MASNEVKIILTAVDKASRELQKVGKTTADFGKTLSAIAGGAAAATGAIAVVGTTMKKAFDLGEEGAQIVQTRESFDLLLKKVGASPELFRQLQAAAKGTIPDMQLMSSTATLLAGASEDLAPALAAATPELLEIAKAANKLNPSLGDTAFQYQSIATGIKRASPLILDNLGLTVKIGDANERYAASLGKSVDQLSAEEQKIALLNETLRAGQILIDQVGGSTDSATDAFQRLDTSVTNIVDNLKAKFAPSLADAAGGLELLLTWNQRINEALDEQEDRLFDTTEAYDDYRSGVIAARIAAREITEAQADYIERIIETGKWTDETAESFGVLSEKEYDARKELEKAISVASSFDAAHLIGQLDDAADAASGLAGANNDIVASLGEVTKATIAKEAIAALNDAYRTGAIDEYDYEIAFRRVAGQVAGFDEHAIDAMLALQDLQEDFANAAGDADELAAAAIAAARALDKIPNEVGVTINYKEKHLGQTGVGGQGGRQSSGGGQSIGQNPGGGGRASGGDVWAGVPYVVGERGPEMFVPNQSGTIVSNDKMRGMGNVYITFPTTILTPQNPEEVFQYTVRRINQAFRNANQAGIIYSGT